MVYKKFGQNPSGTDEKWSFELKGLRTDADKILSSLVDLMRNQSAAGAGGLGIIRGNKIGESE